MFSFLFDSMGSSPPPLFTVGTPQSSPSDHLSVVLLPQSGPDCLPLSDVCASSSRFLRRLSVTYRPGTPTHKT
jgi:hypothetical protein